MMLFRVECQFPGANGIRPNSHMASLTGRISTRRYAQR
jgi:hypothetical protein